MSDQNPTSTSFGIITNKKSKNISTRGIVITIAIVIFLVLGIVAGVLLVRQNQNIQEKAAVTLCPGAGACPVPGLPGLLRNCSPANADGTPGEVSCSNIGMVGTISTCGTQRYCCPSLGASWTTNLTLCTVATPTPTLTATPRATISPIPTSTSTATASATPRVVATPRAIPVTGTDWPTIVGAGVGIVTIIGAILLAI